MSIEDVTIEAARLALRFLDLKVFLLFRTNRMVAAAESVLLRHRVPFRKLKSPSFWERGLLLAWNVVAKIRNG